MLPHWDPATASKYPQGKRMTDPTATRQQRARECVPWYSGTLEPSEGCLDTQSPTSIHNGPYPCPWPCAAGIRFEPPDCLHSPFYPLRGPYSSTSQELIRQHLEEMAKYGVGILVSCSLIFCARCRHVTHVVQRRNGLGVPAAHAVDEPGRHWHGAAREL